jgi:uncharacterized membrane protein
MPLLTLARLQLLASASLIALIFLSLAWELWLAPLKPGGSMWVLKVLPLLAPLFGILHGKLYTYRWSTLLIWFYFAEGTMRAVTEPPPSRWLAVLEVVLSLAFFLSAAWYARSRSKLVSTTQEPNT